MKKIILLLALAGLSLNLKAQQTISLADYKDNLGKTVTLCETVNSFKIISDTLTLVNMGAPYPNQKFVVAIKGNKVSLDWENLKTKHLCVTGVLQLYKNTIQINAFEPNQLVVGK